MCLAVPGKIVEWEDRDPLFAKAAIEFSGVRRSVNMACVPEANEGDYVLVHAGMALTRIDAEEAAKLLQELESLGLEDEATEN